MYQGEVRWDGNELRTPEGVVVAHYSPEGHVFAIHFHTERQHELYRSELLAKQAIQAWAESEESHLSI
jgi:hypothetical protein